MEKSVTVTGREGKKKKEKFTFGSKNIKYRIFVWSILSVQIVHFLIFWLYVNFNSIMLAFKNASGGVEYWTTENFVWVFRELFHPQNDSLQLAFINTMKFFLMNVIIFPLGLFYAYAFYKKMPGRSFYRLMFYIPVIVSGVVVSTFYRYMLQPKGPIGLLYTNLTGEIAPSFLREKEYALKAVMIYSLWAGISGNLLVVGGALARIPPEIIESGKMDGIGWLREMWQLCIPIAWPTVSIILLMMIANIFNTTGDILLLTGRIRRYDDNQLLAVYADQIPVVLLPAFRVRVGVDGDRHSAHAGHETFFRQDLRRR